MGERDQVFAKRRDDINMGGSVKESVREIENEVDSANDQGRENNLSQEEREQTFEPHSDTGMCNTAMKITMSISCYYM